MNAFIKGGHHEKDFSLNQDWLFVHRDTGMPGQMPQDGVCASLPHTWNTVDGYGGHDIDAPAKDWSRGDLTGVPAPHYNQGSCWYYKTFATPRQPLPGERVYVEVLTAGLQATIYYITQK